MAITHEPKGTAALKASGRVLEIASVQAGAGKTLSALVAYDNSQGEPTVVRAQAGASVTITRSGGTATVSHTAHGLASDRQTVIHGANEDDYNGLHVITVTGPNAYTYEVAGSPATPATGTILSSAVTGKAFNLMPGRKRANAGTGKTIGQWRKKVRKGGTRSVFATWSGSIAARAMVLRLMSEASRQDVGNDNEQDGTTAPATGAAVTSTAPATLSVAGFMAAGPSSDAAWATVSAGSGHTLGQRVGTTGAPPASNITLQETTELLSATGNIRATLSGAPSRDYAAVITAFAKGQTYKIGLTDHLPWDAGVSQEAVRFDIKNEAGNVVDQLPLPIEAFRQLSDDQVKNCFNYAGQVLDEKAEGPTAVNPVDPEIEARAETFEDFEFTV